MYINNVHLHISQVTLYIGYSYNVIIAIAYVRVGEVGDWAMGPLNPITDPDHVPATILAMHRYGRHDRDIVSPDPAVIMLSCSWVGVGRLSCTQTPLSWAGNVPRVASYKLDHWIGSCTVRIQFSVYGKLLPSIELWKGMISIFYWFSSP